MFLQHLYNSYPIYPACSSLFYYQRGAVEGPAQKRWKKLAQNMKVVAARMKKSDSSNKWIALNEDVPSRRASEISLDKPSKLD